MKGKLSELTKEDKRQICLDLSQVIHEAGEDGLSKSEIFEKFEGNEEYSQSMYVEVLLTDFLDCLGKNNVRRGERRWTRYVVDSQETAESIINDYFDSRMNELDKWELYKDICSYIHENGVVLDTEVSEHFTIELERIYEMNSELIKLNMNVGLDPFNKNSQGTKLRLFDGTLSEILSKIEKLKIEENEKLNRKKSESARNSKMDKKDAKDNKHIIPMDPKTKRIVQRNLLEIIYSDPKSSMTYSKISYEYRQRMGAGIQYNSIDSMLKGVPGVKLHKDYYEVTNIVEALEYVDPLRSKVRIEVGMRKGIKVEYTNMRFSRELGEYNIYILEDDNKYELYIQILDLLLMGASIDEHVTTKVRHAVTSNMSRGMKSIL
jgi:hypothetical protein